MPHSLPNRGGRAQTNARTKALREFTPDKQKTATGTGTVGGGT